LPFHGSNFIPQFGNKWLEGYGSRVAQSVEAMFNVYENASGVLQYARRHFRLARSKVGFCVVDQPEADPHISLDGAQ
jgi:hypothetical protein